MQDAQHHSTPHPLVAEAAAAHRWRRISRGSAAGFCVLILSILSALGPACTEPLPPAMPSSEQDVYFSVVEKIIQIGRDEIRPHVPSEQLALFDAIKVEIARTDQNFFRARAVTESGQPKVVLSAGLLLSLRGLDDATGYFLLHDRKLFADYLEYYAKYVRYVDGEIKHGRSPQRYSHFCEYPPGRKQSCAQRVQTELVQRSQVAVKYATITFIVAHEIGHHLLGHTKDKESGETYERERAADAFAVQLLRKAGIPPDLTIGTFYVLAFLSYKAPFTPNATKHPHPFCRWAELFASDPPMTAERLKPAQQHGFNFSVEGMAKDAAAVKKLAAACNASATKFK